MSAAGGYEAVVGLEIHVQLATRTKMFCGCEPSFGAEPNTRTCQICLAHPGTLPVPNEQAVRLALQIALALECEVAPRSIFARKNYFYPDIPKGYQISQYEEPLAVNGRLGDIRIHRVHMEEDTAKSIHVGESGRIHGSADSLVDFNRAGTPLVEIVTEPDLRDAAQARDWAALLRTTIKQLGASDVNMEEGSLRVDANVSIRKEGATELGTKTELKNMNSFRFLERGIAAERRQRYLSELGLPEKQATQLAFDGELGAYFEEVVAAGDGAAPSVVANWVTGELAAAEREGDEAATHVPAESLARLIEMVETNTISHGAGRQVLTALVAEGGDPAAIVEREGLAAVSDEGELGAIVERALEADPKAAEQVRSGNMKAVGPLVGFVMRETRGAADGGEVTRLIREKLGL